MSVEINYQTAYDNLKYSIDFGYWTWFPNNNWHLVDRTCGEPQRDEYMTLCGQMLDGLFNTRVQEDHPLLYCKDCQNVRTMQWLAE